MFQALGGSNFNIGKAWESLEQLVAPLPMDDESHDAPTDDVGREDEEDNDFESAILQHIVNKRQEIEQDEARRQGALDIIPASPSSMSTITLDGEEEDYHSHYGQDTEHSQNVSFLASITQPDANKFKTSSSYSESSTPPKSQSTSSVFLSNAELEKKVQFRYREQLENEVERFEKRIREQKETFENILLNVQEERDFYMKKVSILEENGRLDAVVENQQQEILELQEMMRDLSGKLHTSLEDKATLDEKNKKYALENQQLRDEITRLSKVLADSTDTTSSDLSKEEQFQIMEQLNRQINSLNEEIDGFKSTISILSRENESLVVELSEKDLEIQKLQSSSSSSFAMDDHDSVNNAREHPQNQVTKQLLEESEKANDALRQELASVKLEYTTASISWERAKAVFEKEIVQMRTDSQNKDHETITQLQSEIQRLESALTESEHLLKEAEEITWKSKAEASEILWAYQSDQDKWHLERERFTSAQVDLQQELTKQQQHVVLLMQQIADNNASAIDTDDGKNTHDDGHSEHLQRQRLLYQEYFTKLAQTLTLQLSSAASSVHDSSHHNSNGSSVPKTTEIVWPTVAETLLPLALTQPFTAQLSTLVTSYHHHQTHCPQEIQTLVAEKQQYTQQQMQQCAQLTSQLLLFQKFFLSSSAAPPSESPHGTNTNNDSSLETLTSLVTWMHSELEKSIQANAAQEKSLQTELMRVKAEVASLQDQQQRHSSTSTEQLSDVRAKLTAAEDEIRKLHQVIAQLRSLRRAKDGEEQSAQQELGQLRSLYQQSVKDKDNLQQRVYQLESYEHQYLTLKTQYDDLIQLHRHVEESLLETKRYLAGKEKQCYDQLTALDVAQAEQRLLSQEMSLRIQEIDNLNDALSHIEESHQAQLQSLRRQISDIEASKETYAKDVAAQQSEMWKKSLLEVQKHAQQLARQLEDQELLHRQQVLSITQEKQQLQKALQNAVDTLQHSSQDVIDRAFMVNLLVQYFQRKRSKEVLSLIARVLALTEEQLVIVGLKGAPVDIVNTLVTTVIGPATTVPVEGDNLAELWVNYLIHQASSDSAVVVQPSAASAPGISVLSAPPSTPHRAQNNNNVNSNSTSTSNSSSNFHSLPASPANNSSGSSGSSSNGHSSAGGGHGSNGKSLSLFHDTDESSSKPGGLIKTETSSTANNINNGSGSSSSKQEEELPPLGGFLGVATSILGGFWRR